MKRLIFSISALFVALTFFVSCSKEEPQKKDNYSWSIAMLVSTTSSESAVEDWFNEKVDELNKQHKGSSTSLDEANAAMKKAVDAIANLKKEYEEYLNIHDFGKSKFECEIVAELLKNQEVLESKVESFKYSNTRVRFNNEETRVLEEVLEMLEFSAAYQCDYVFGLEEFGFDVPAVSSLTIDASKAKVFNTKTSDIYPGANFLGSMRYVEKEVVVNMKFEQSHASDYAGEWYILVPVTVNDDTNLDLVISIKI